MPVPEEFYRDLPKRSTDSLMDILAAPGEYLPEAVDAAVLELKRRGVSEEALVANIEPKVEAIKVTQAVAQEPLEWPMRFFCLILPLFSFRFGRNYRRQGQDAKSDECYSWGTAGIGVYIIAGAVAKYFEK